MYIYIYCIYLVNFTVDICRYSELVFAESLKQETFSLGAVHQKSWPILDTLQKKQFLAG